MRRADPNKRAQLDKFGKGKHGFQSGNPVTGQLPTIPGAAWFDSVQEEIANVIEETQIQVDPDNNRQLLEAITQLITTHAPKMALSNRIDGNSEDVAASEKAVAEAAKRGVPLGAVVAFPRAVANPTGYLKADGSSFDAATYPDLYKALGNTNRLPDLRRSDVGMTAYFAVDAVPEGWLAFDDIAAQVTASAYPELHAHLLKKYGNIERVPKAADRFIRNASGGLTVGQTQEDELRSHNHKLPTISSPTLHPMMGKLFTDFVSAPESYVLGADGNTSDNGWARPIHTESYTGGSETRPRSLVLKLCIKAQNSLDDVQFWVKAYGGIVNEGSLDASALAADIHNLRVRCDGLAGELAALTGQFTAQVGTSGYQRLPNGLILQWGQANAGKNGTAQRVHFPIAFPSKVASIQAIHIGSDANANIIVNQDGNRLTGFEAKSNFALHDIFIHWFALGY